MATEDKVSFRSPYYDRLALSVEERLQLPSGLLKSIVTNGERSNANQVSEANAKTVFQIIPATRDAILKKHGIDAYLSPENAAEAAGLLLKESLARNNNDPALAAAEYHAGPNRKGWGPKTRAYVERVTSGLQSQQADNLLTDLQSWKQQAAAEAPTGQALQAKTGEQQRGGDDDLIAAARAWKSGQKPVEEPGFVDRTMEAITGRERATPESQALPEWTSMPELNSLSMASLKTAMGTLISNPAETVQIIQANAPGVQVRQDAKGNYILRSGQDGQEYVIPPGFSAGDIPRAAGALAAFTPAGRAGTILGSGAAAAGTQAAIEAAQAGAGGSFDPAEVAAAGVAGAAIPAVVSAARAAGQPAKQALDRALGRAPAAPTATPAAPGPVSPAVQAAPAPSPAAAPVAALPAEQLAQTARAASGGGIGSGRAREVLATQAMPDAKVTEAARRLGIEDYLQPDHVTTNQAYRELAQAVKSIPGSEARSAELSGLDAVAKRADDLIDEIGGTSDLSTLSANVQKRMRTTQAELEKTADDLYSQVRQAIPAKTEASAQNTLGFLRQHADDVGGENRLLPVEKKLLSALDGEDGPLTYAFLDQTRKQVGQAMRKSSGPFADSESGLLKRLYSALSDDQMAVAESAGAGQLYKAAQASVAVRKGLEDDLVALFGKNLDKSLVGDLSGAVRALPKGDSAKLVSLLKSVPGDMRENVVASGLASAFRTAGTRGNINFNTYAKWFEGLKNNKQAYTALMSNLPQSSRKQLSDLYRVANGISSATRERITTGRIQAVSEELKGADTMMANIFSLARRASVGAAAEVVTAPLGMPGAGISAGIASALTKGKTSPLKAADALISSPEFIAMTRHTTGPQRTAAASRFARSKSFNRFGRAVGNPREMSNKEKWVLQSLQARNNQEQ